MPLKEWTTTTNALGAYLGGASLSDYMTRSGQWNYTSQLSAPVAHWINHEATGLMFGWRNDVSGREFAHLMAIKQPETSLESSDAESLKWRVVCHYLVDLVSDEGLPELLESLRDNLEFYHRSLASQSKQLTGNVPVRVKLGQQYERPAFEFAKE